MKSSRKAVLTAIVSDLAIATAKLTAWAFTHSSGMLSEAIHSLVDAGNGSLLVLGLHRSRKQADETHPFGYGKELYFWTLLVALFVFFAGGGASIAEGYLRVRNPQPLDHYLWNYVTLGVAALFEAYSLYVGLEEFRAGEGVPASWQAIRASKNPSTFTVIVEDFAALAGLFIAFLGTIFDQTLGWHRADGISPLAIGVHFDGGGFVPDGREQGSAGRRRRRLQHIAGDSPAHAGRAGCRACGVSHDYVFRSWQHSAHDEYSLFGSLSQEWDRRGRRSHRSHDPRAISEHSPYLPGGRVAPSQHAIG